MMKKVTEADVKREFSAFLKESQNGPVVVMRNGKPIAVLMAVHDEDELDRLVFASSPRLQGILEEGRKEIRDGRGIPNAEFWKQVEAEQPKTKTGKKKPRRASATTPRT